MRPSLAHILAGLVLLTLAGCADKPTRLYVLTATTEKPAATSPSGLAIGIGPITLPKYLDRPQIVSSVEANSLDQANFDQWGGDLNDNITRVLATNLSNLPMQALLAKLNYQLSGVIHNLDEGDPELVFFKRVR